MNDTLFLLPPPVERPQQTEARPAARVVSPNREQLELRAVDLESLLPADHRARLVWDFVTRLDLTPLYEKIGSVEGGAGRPATDPRVPMALWLYATLEGVGSARALDRLCDEHDAYRWLCGGVGVNHHSLADFRVEHVEFLDRTLTTSIASLMATGAVTLERVAQDGVRVRASAGAASFRRRSEARAAPRRRDRAGRGAEAGAARRPGGDLAPAPGSAAAGGSGATAAGRRGAGAAA